MAEAQDDEYEIPLRDQRVFGAGIKRKRIQFVASTATNTGTPSLPVAPHASASTRYLNIVLKSSTSSDPIPTTDEEARITTDEAGASTSMPPPTRTCDICHRPLSPTAPAASLPHESSMAHQICLPHSHPPSHVDRTLKSLAILQTSGWDPDSRLGLGAVGGEGRLYPIKARENPQRTGLGAKVDAVKVVERPVKLDAGKVRALEKEGRGKAERLRNAFYRSEEVEKYLSQGVEGAGLDLRAFGRAKRGF
ncbi:hypothetical protein LTR53_010385 [Teratosphaeriaceae sp. CCFEE 6253]|nr:hypothetical protein LTR53_010385 [Teratosphaeriaceae sp. CCFEE 6253]